VWVEPMGLSERGVHMQTHFDGERYWACRSPKTG
jgi:hypothetical protein